MRRGPVGMGAVREGLAGRPAPGGAVTCLVAEPAHLCARPALLLNLAGDCHTSLHVDPYDIPVRSFLAAGHRAASLDLPCHGERRVPGYPEGIAGFATELAEGWDVLTGFVAEGRAAIDSLVAQGLAESGRVFLTGTSRGGYCALRLAAADARVAGVAAYAPVTDWRMLQEFAAIRDRDEVEALALRHVAPELAGRLVWVAIGNRDDRVGTDRCLEFAAALLAAEESAGVTSSRFRLHVVPEDGHALSSEWRRHGAECLLAAADSL